jgi:hypothetical protein
MAPALEHEISGDVESREQQGYNTTSETFKLMKKALRTILDLWTSCILLFLLVMQQTWAANCFFFPMSLSLSGLITTEARHRRCSGSVNGPTACTHSNASQFTWTTRLGVDNGMCQRRHVVSLAPKIHHLDLTLYGPTVVHRCDVMGPKRLVPDSTEEVLVWARGPAIFVCSSERVMQNRNQNKS